MPGASTHSRSTMNDDTTLRDKERIAKAALIQSVQLAAAERSNLIEAVDPPRAIQALFLLATGTSKNQAAKLAGIDERTLARLLERHADSLKMIRESSALKAAAVGEKGLELMGKKFQQLDEDPDALAQIDPAKLAVATGIMIDKAAGLEGRASVVIEHRSAPSRQEYREALKQAQARVIDVETIKET